jgi:hypothetical protein
MSDFHPCVGKFINNLIGFSADMRRDESEVGEN